MADLSCNLNHVFATATASGVTVDAFGVATVTGAATATSIVSKPERLWLLSYVLKATTANGVGTFALMASDNGVDYLDVTADYAATKPNRTAANVASANLVTGFSTPGGFPYAYVKVIYTQASGTTVLDGSFHAKS